jgi:hypothetical protein
MEQESKPSDPDTAALASSKGTLLDLPLARTGMLDRCFEVTGDNDIFEDGEYVGLD